MGIAVKVSPAASGPVTVDIERFDPVFGWQFYREAHAFAHKLLLHDPRRIRIFAVEQV